MAAAPPCFSTIATRRRGAAPSAERMPISRRRCVTEYETTPYSPTAARASATPPNTVKKVAIQRAWASESATLSDIGVTVGAGWPGVTWPSTRRRGAINPLWRG